MLGSRECLELAFHRSGPGISPGDRGVTKSHDLYIVGKAGAVADHISVIDRCCIGQHHVLQLSAIVSVTHIRPSPLASQRAINVIVDTFMIATDSPLLSR